MNYTIAIIEGTLNSHNVLKKHLEISFPELNIIGASKRVVSAIDLIHSWSPDIVFLGDILIDGSGTEVLSTLSDAIHTQIVYLQNSPKKLDDDLRKKINCHLTKPLSLEDITSAINQCKKTLKNPRVINNLESNNTPTNNLIAIPSLLLLDIYKYDEILYLKAHGRYTSFNLVDGNSKIACKNLGSYENILDSYSFFRIHNSYIINYNYLKKINNHNSCELIDNLELPISRRRRESFKFFVSKL